MGLHTQYSGADDDSGATSTSHICKPLEVLVDVLTVFIGVLFLGFMLWLPQHLSPVNLIFGAIGGILCLHGVNGCAHTLVDSKRFPLRLKQWGGAGLVIIGLLGGAHPSTIPFVVFGAAVSADRVLASAIISGTFVISFLLCGVALVRARKT